MSISTKRRPAATAAPAVPGEAVLQDYRIAYRSRQTSTLARGEVMLGRAMFGIFGDGKEVAQVALARAFQPGDVRSGYYRDQTLMFALGLLTTQQFFAQLYAHTDVAAEPASAVSRRDGDLAPAQVLVSRIVLLPRDEAVADRRAAGVACAEERVPLTR